MLAAPRAALLAADPYAGAALVLDVQRGVYRRAGVHAASLSALPGASFSRASVGTARTLDGAVSSFASGAPRITDAGLLVEETRTNMLVRSQEIANASWLTFSGASKTGASAVAAPDGTTTAYRVSLPAAAGSFDTAGAVYQAPVTLVSGQVYSFSVWLRAGSGSPQVRIGIATAGGVSTTSAATTLSTTAWTRLTVTGTSSVTSSNVSIRSGANAVSDVLVWGAQLEAASTVTSYLATTTAAATRAADDVTIDLTGVSGETITVDFGAASSVAVARSSLANPNLLVLSASANGAWKNAAIRKVVMR